MALPRLPLYDELGRAYHYREHSIHGVRRDDGEGFRAEGLNAYFGLGVCGRGGGRVRKGAYADKSNSFASGLHSGLPAHSIPWMTTAGPHMEVTSQAPDATIEIHHRFHAARHCKMPTSGPDAIMAECQLTRIASYWRRLRKGVERESGGGGGAVERARKVEKVDEDVCASMPGGWRREEPYEASSFSGSHEVAVVSHSAIKSNCATSNTCVSQGVPQRTSVPTREIDGDRKYMQGSNTRYTDCGVNMETSITSSYDLRHLPPVWFVHPREAATPRANRAVARVHNAPRLHAGSIEQELDQERDMLASRGRPEERWNPRSHRLKFCQSICSPAFIALIVALLKLLLAVYAAVFAWHVGVVLVRLLSIFSRPLSAIHGGLCWFWTL